MERFRTGEEKLRAAKKIVDKVKDGDVIELVLLYIIYCNKRNSKRKRRKVTYYCYSNFLRN